MFYFKNTVFFALTKNQKSSLLTFLRNFVKKNSSFSKDEIVNLFIEEEIYYNEVKNPHFEWIIPLLDDDNFIKEINLVVGAYLKQIEEKNRQKPYLEKQKQYLKEQRKKAQDFKLSKEPATEKQLKYYKMLCERYNLPLKLGKESSRLDLKNKIGKILEEYSKKFV